MTHETVLDSATAADGVGRTRGRPRAARLAALAESKPGPRPGAAGRTVRRRRQGTFAGATSGAVRRTADRDTEPVPGPAAGIGHGRDAARAGPDEALRANVAGGEATVPRRADQPPGRDAEAHATT